MNNPYRVGIGEIPERYIESGQVSELVNMFQNNSNSCCILIGPSGVGKTVTMTKVSKIIAENNKWIVVNLNPVGDLLRELVVEIYTTGQFAYNFIEVRLNTVVCAQVNPPELDAATLLRLLLTDMKSRDMKLLVCIDEVTKNDSIIRFLKTYQIMLRELLPVNILLAGLYSEIALLVMEGNLSFFNRARKLNIDTLNITRIASDYEKMLNIRYEKALELAYVTGGFPTAFQTLGSLLWDYDADKAEGKVLEEYDDALYQYSYRDIINRLNDKEKKFLIEMIENGDGLIMENHNQYENIMTKLINHGILSNYGHNDRICLPRFKEIFMKTLNIT